MEFLGILENIGFDWRVALANFVNFLIIFYLLKRFVFPALQQMLQARQKKINEGLEHAQQAASELMMAEQKREEIVHEARTEARHIVDEARSREKEMLRVASEHAEQKAKELRLQAEQDILRAREEMQQEVKRHAIDLAVAGAEKIIRTKLDDKKDKELITNMLS